mmetsp:Transcript_31474/g.102551  ORF Transcript_31474/g.102551 Transcript_31474/m.102551 type:complete len:204 (+) Transcript_31474:2-613(+)
MSESVYHEALSRGQWLVALLILQSASGVILQKYSALIQEHLVVTVFLTMLVGAGGNAGNQSVIKVIEGLATGELQPTMNTFLKVFYHQGCVGFVLAVVLSTFGAVRVYATGVNGERRMDDIISVTLALFCIVLTSCFMGASLPFFLAWLGLDPENAGTTIQVLMDIIGVMITCTICQLVLKGQSAKNAEGVADAPALDNSTLL